MMREADIAAFLARHGYGLAEAEPLAQDASFRRYHRLIGGPRPALLMDAPPPEDIGAFVGIGRHLGELGVTVPGVFAADVERGLLLEEDLGDTMVSHLVEASGPREVFDAIVDTLVVMHRAAPPPSLPQWDAEVMATAAMGTLFDWWWPAAFAEPAPDEARRDFAAALAAVLAPVADGPVSFVHRDFFVENLLWLPRRHGIARVGVIDFQSAATGHPAYDLVSLLQDARRDIAHDLAEHAIERYLAARPELDARRFRAAYVACAAQRHLRVACQWVRLARRDNRPRYLIHGPRTWRLLQHAMRDPSVAPLADAFDRWIPAGRRGNPP
ncbi:MAG TPA: phosphotransferase [Acetobacteraceae bacterium]|jgi:aminoglycoside/choline kinase family phosphotransferase|nr:phosphotransferase [Acetobacteraceae bacterium]